MWSLDDWFLSLKGNFHAVTTATRTNYLLYFSNSTELLWLLFSDACEECPVSTTPVYGYDLRWWHSLPPHMTAYCFSVSSKNAFLVIVIEIQYIKMNFSHTAGSHVSWKAQPDLYYDKQNFNNIYNWTEHNATTWDRLSLIDQESVENHTAIKPNSKTEKTG